MFDKLDPHPLNVREIRLRRKRKQLRTILYETLQCATLRAAIDGERSGKVDWLIESLRLHIRNVELGCATSGLDDAADAREGIERDCAQSTTAAS